MRKYLILFVLCFTIFIVHLIGAGHGIYGDGNAYYSYTHTLYFEKSLNFDPIYSHLEHFQTTKSLINRISWPTFVGPLGVRNNVFEIGTGLTWLPSLFVINLVSILARLNLDKFSLVYEIGPGISGILFMVLGFYFLEKYLRNFFSEKVSFWSVLIFFLTSNALYYSSFEPALSHQPAFFIVSFLLYKTYKMKASSLNFLIVGFLSGFLLTVRIADVILLIPIAFQALKAKPNLQKILIAILGAFLATLPLLISQYYIFGNALINPLLSGRNSAYFIFKGKQIVDFFFSAKRGAFIWNPIYLVSLTGIFFSKKKVIILLTLTLLILVSSFYSSNTSAGFGQRYLFSAIPYFAYGLASLIQKVNFKFTIVLFVVLLIWNLLTLFQFYFDSQNLEKNENLTLQMFITGQFTAPVKALKIISNEGFKNFFYNKILD